MPKFQHILFPVDLSESTRCIVPFVKKMAYAHGAKISVLSVVEFPPFAYGSMEAGIPPVYLSGEFESSWRQSVEKFVESEFSGYGTPVGTTVVTGHPATSISEFASQNHVDLIMMPTHGMGVFRRVLLGSTSAKVLHDAECSVWTAAHASEQPWLEHLACQRILCATDLGPNSVRLVQTAKELAKTFSAELRLVHTVPSAETRPALYFDTEFHQARLKSADDEMRKLRELVGTEAAYDIESEDVEKAIRHVALRHKSDLIVIDRGRLTARFGRLRTHSYAIIRESPCPVISI
jgi:nucleotide-binding universal stress UspA family protein